MVTGFDCSDNNNITWETISPDFQFVFVKKSEGISFTSKTYEYRKNYLKNSNLAYSFYHYFRPQDSIQEQLNNFLNGLESTPMPCVLDAEEPGITVAMVTEFLAGIQQATGRKPILYSYPSFLTDDLQGHQFDAYLWVAAYQDNPPNFNWIFWQKSERGDQNGNLTGGDLDIDVTNLTLEQLKAL